MSTEKFPVAIFGDNFAAVGLAQQSTNRVELKYCECVPPVVHKGERFLWKVWIEERLSGSGPTVLLINYLRDRRELDAALPAWEKRLPQIVAARKPKPVKRISSPKPPAPPSRCTPISDGDRKLHAEAMLNVLAHQYPRTVKALRSKFASKAALNRAYFADCAQILGKVPDEAEPEHAGAVGEALVKFSEGKINRASPVDLEIVFGWFARGYCFLAEKDLAAAVNSKCGTALTPAAIKKRRERLGLSSKRGPGPDYVYR